MHVAVQVYRHDVSNGSRPIFFYTADAQCSDGISESKTLKSASTCCSMEQYTYQDCSTKKVG